MPPHADGRGRARHSAARRRGKSEWRKKFRSVIIPQRIWRRALPTRAGRALDLSFTAPLTEFESTNPLTQPLALFGDSGN